MSSSYRMELDRWLKNLDVKAGKVMDIGGSQLPVKGRTKSWDVGEYIIADLEAPHIDSPKPDVIFDLNSFEGSPYEYDEKIDLVFCLEVFDYIFDPRTALWNIGDILKSGGEAWVTFPFVYPTHQPIEDDALRYTEFGVKKLAEATDLTIQEIIRRRPETDAIEQLWRRERMRAAKNYDHDVTGWIVKFKK